MGFYSYNNDVQAQPAAELDLNIVMRQVYIWMTLGLLATAGTAFFMASSGATIRLFSDPLLMIATIIGYLILAFALQPIVMRAQPVVGILAYFAITVLLGVMISSIFFTVDVQGRLALGNFDSIGFAFIATAGTFGAMSIVGYTTKVDLTKFGGILLMALIGLIVASIVNIFLASNALYWIINYAGVLIFCGLTAYDTQRIRSFASAISRTNDVNAITRVALMGAFRLYLDFINLFLFILRIIMGGGRGR